MIRDGRTDDAIHYLRIAQSALRGGDKWPAILEMRDNDE